MKVICKAKESDRDTISDKNEVNIEIQSSKNCTAQYVKTTCYGTDPNCPGLPFLFYRSYQVLLKIVLLVNTKVNLSVLSFKGLWRKEVENKDCINHQTIFHVNDQLECQQRCLTESYCVGISYRYSSLHIGHCQICLDDGLSNSENNSGFYRRPGIYMRKFICLCIRVI